MHLTWFSGYHPISSWAIFLMFTGILSSCTEPIATRTAQLGFAKLKPVLESLHVYEASEGRYPAHLEQIFVGWMPSGILVESRQDLPQKFFYFLDHSGRKVPMSYRSDGYQTFELSFRFANPEQNFCKITNELESWSCFAAS